MENYDVNRLISKCQKVPWLPLGVVVGYVVFVNKYKNPRPNAKCIWDEEDMTLFLRCWNLTLAMFSLWGVSNTWRYLGAIYTLDVCNPPPMLGEEGYAMGAFALSKFVELGDTVFLAVRNRKISFLHSYHHSSVLLLTWVLFVSKESIGPVFVGMNYFVHVFLYVYYLAASFPQFSKRVRLVAPVVTTLQIVQMIFGVVVCAYAFVRKVKGYTCETSAVNAALALCSYTVYFALFTNLWVELYGRPFNKDSSALGPPTKLKKKTR
jgi:elongation of very long chain fatty acids protein 6